MFYYDVASQCRGTLSQSEYETYGRTMVGGIGRHHGTLLTDMLLVDMAILINYYLLLFVNVLMASRGEGGGRKINTTDTCSGLFLIYKPPSVHHISKLIFLTG